LNKEPWVRLGKNSSKILVKILGGFRVGHKLENELSDDQFEFRRNKGTRETILNLRILIGKRIEFNKNTFIV